MKTITKKLQPIVEFIKTKRIFIFLKNIFKKIQCYINSIKNKRILYKFILLKAISKKYYRKIVGIKYDVDLSYGIINEDDDMDFTMKTLEENLHTYFNSENSADKKIIYTNMIDGLQEQKVY